jgi:hypothetical protein
MISTVAFALAGVPGVRCADVRGCAGVAVPSMVRPDAPTTRGTGVPSARRRALAVGRTFSGAPAALPAQHVPGFEPITDQPTDDATPLGIRSPGRPSS